jgi:NADPH:quinone reductase
MASNVSKTQAAVVINKTGGTDVLEYKTDFPVPTLKDGEILIKNEFIGINFIDTYFRSGLYPAPSFPYVLGREGAGIVVSVSGSQSHELKVGDEVVYMGEAAYAEYTAVPAGRASKLPEGISAKTATAALLQGLTAWTLLKDAYPVKKGDYILVTAAAGGTGQWLVTAGKHLGAIVIATCSTAKIDIVKGLGADHVIDYSVPGGLGFAAKVKALTPNNEGVAAVYDSVGKNTFDAALASVKRNGYLLSFGNASGAPDPLHIARLSANNVRLMRPTLFNFIATPEELDRNLTELWDFVVKGHHEVPVHKVYDLKDAAQAQDDLEGRKTTGKLLLKP